MTTRLYKLGGSLLTRRDLAGRVRKVLAQRPESRPLLVVGGGAAADLVREWDRLHQLGPEQAHRLALRSMSLNEELLSELMPETRAVTSRDEARQAWAAGRLPIIRTSEFLRVEERQAAVPLPHTWDATSDSIAAWIAFQWPADALVLMKSVSLPPKSALDRLLPRGLVDPYFPHLAHRLPNIDWINLRDGEPAVTPLRVV